MLANTIHDITVAQSAEGDEIASVVTKLSQLRQTISGLESQLQQQHDALLTNLGESLGQVRESRLQLIDAHFSAGAHLAAWRDWWYDLFDDKPNSWLWLKYAIHWLYNQGLDYQYSLTTAKRDYRLWVELGQQRQAILESDVQLTIGALYALVDHGGKGNVSAMSLMLDLMTEIRQRSATAMPMPEAANGHIETTTTSAPLLMPGVVTAKQIENVLKTNEAIAAIADEARPVVEEIAHRWGVTSPAAVEEIAALRPEDMEVVRDTGALTTYDQDGEAVKTIPVAAAGAGEIKTFRHAQETARRQRRAGHIQDSMDTRKGIISNRFLFQEDVVTSDDLERVVQRFQEHALPLRITLHEIRYAVSETHSETNTTTGE